LLIGKKYNFQIKQINGCVYRFFNPPNGRLKSIENLNKVKLIKGVLDFEIFVKPGDIIKDLKNSLDRCGYVVTKGKDREEAIEIADKAEKLIRFNYY
jgi:hypothetical protein